MISGNVSDEQPSAQNLRRNKVCNSRLFKRRCAAVYPSCMNGVLNVAESLQYTTSHSGSVVTAMPIAGPEQSANQKLWETMVNGNAKRRTQLRLRFESESHR